MRFAFEFCATNVGKLLRTFCEGLITSAEHGPPVPIQLTVKWDLFRLQAHFFHPTMASRKVKVSLTG